jgi:hypothetical protein
LASDLGLPAFNAADSSDKVIIRISQTYAIQNSSHSSHTQSPHKLE